MLTFTTADALLAAPEPVRYLHALLLMAVRDGAERLEFRPTEDGWVLYQRTDSRDWEMSAPPEDVQSELKAAVRSVSRLVSPERPELTVSAGPAGAVYEPHEVGWLTLQLSGYLLDLEVRIDPQEPYGSVRLDFPADASALADAAGDAVNEYLAALADDFGE